MPDIPAALPDMSFMPIAAENSQAHASTAPRVSAAPEIRTGLESNDASGSVSDVGVDDTALGHMQHRELRMRIRQLYVDRPVRRRPPAAYFASFVFEAMG